MKSHEKTDTLKYLERVSNTFQPTSWSIMLQSVDARDLYTRRHAHSTRESHVMEDKEAYIPDRVIAHVPEVETHDQGASFHNFQGKSTLPSL
jgi:hypothetical protein